MIRSALKNNLILSLIIFNLGLILCLAFSEMNNVHLTNTDPPPYISEQLRWVIAVGIILFGALSIIYSVHKIFKENKKLVNSESSSPQDV